MWVSCPREPSLSLSAPLPSQGRPLMLPWTPGPTPAGLARPVHGVSRVPECADQLQEVVGVWGNSCHPEQSCEASSSLQQSPLFPPRPRLEALVQRGLEGAPCLNGGAGGEPLFGGCKCSFSNHTGFRPQPREHTSQRCHMPAEVMLVTRSHQEVRTQKRT